MPQTTTPLALSWLGTPLVRLADRPLTFPTRKAVALLVYLTVEAGSHSREKLTTLFWPESDTRRGRGMLRTTLAHLREALAPLATVYLIVEPQTLSFNFDSSLDLDLHRVQAGLDAVQHQPPPSARGQSMSLLQTAVNRWRGDFLEGFSLADAAIFDNWASLQRESWHRRLNLLFDTLSQWQFEAGDLSAALETATRWQAHDLYSERAPQRLMHLHFANGNRAAALEVYDTYKKGLAADFGAKPAAEMKALAARIRASSPGRHASAAAPLVLAPAALPFVGRGEEFAHLMATYALASGGQPQVVILMGEAGIGKTRLTGKFLHWARSQGADILASRAFETEGEVPYQVVAQCLRHRLEQENDLTDLLSTTWLAELSRLLPELRDRYPALPHPQSDDATAQYRLLEAVTRLGQALADRAPMVMCLDDLQWADSASLDALPYAMVRWAEHQAPILLLLCTRELFTTNKSNLRPWVASLKTKVTVTPLALAPLTVEDTLVLLDSLAAGQARGSRPAQQVGRHKAEPLAASANALASLQYQAFAQALFTETGGHPLYLVETLKALLEQQMLVPYQATGGMAGLQWRTLAGETNGQFPRLRIIPHSVREVILDRLSRLTAAARAMLTAAAVLERTATFRQLIDVSGLEQMVGLDALEELVGKHLLLDAGQAGDEYLIAHDKIREVLYHECSAVRRQVLHRRAVTVLQDSDPARVAYHARLAGMDAEAFYYSLVAGDAALRLFAASEAIIHYEAAHQLVTAGQLPQVALDQVAHLYTSLGRALDLNGQFETAMAVYEALKTIAQQRDAPALRLVALTGQVTLRSRPPLSFNPMAGEVLAQEALGLSRELSNPAAEAEILCYLVHYYRLSNRLPEALRCGDQALAVAHAFNLREQTAAILEALIRCHMFSGRLDLAEQAQRKASELWRVLNNLPLLAQSLADAAFLARWAGDYDRALALSAEAYQLSRSITHVWAQSCSQLVVGYVYWERGQPADAMAVMQESIRLAEATNYLMPQILTRADLGALYASLGDSQRGVETLQLALQLADTQFPLYRAYVVGLLARLYVRQNLLDAAATLLAQAKQGSPPPFFSFLFQWINVAESEVALGQGDPARAVAVAETMLQAVIQSGIRSVITEVLYVKAQSFAAMGEVALAYATLAQARTAAERLGSRRMLTQILTRQADLAGDPDQAAHLRQQAEAISVYISHHTPPELRPSLQALLKAERVRTNLAIQAP